MAGLGLTEYFAESFNIFDLVVVGLSMLELGLMTGSGSQGGSLSALQTFKTLRIMKSFRVLRMLRMFRCATHMLPALVTSACPELSSPCTLSGQPESSRMSVFYACQWCTSLAPFEFRTSCVVLSI
jgi:hypothetical protein